MSLRRRTYPEVLANLLSGISGGVAAESHPFPPPGASGPPFAHILQQPPAAEVISIFGSRDGEPYLFRNDADYKLLPDRQTIQWQEGAALPDAGTLVDVNYRPVASQAVLTDLQAGSVVRTLAETIGLEIARLYAQLDAVYRAGFVDTAEGSSLDKVVALLGVERVAGGRATGEVEFTRARGTAGLITIPTGTRVMTADGSVEYETAATVTMAEAQNTVRVTARDLEPNDPLLAGALTVLPAPIAGIAGVTNPAPTAIEARNETDAELRSRAKNFLHGSERATIGAIEHAIARQGLSADVEEPQDKPGEIVITPHAALTPEQAQRLATAIMEAKPAGVVQHVAGGAPPEKVDLELHLTTVSGLIEQDLRAAQHAVRDKIQEYFERLPAKEPGSINRIVGLVLSVPQVQDVRIVNASVTRDGVDESVLDLEAGLLSIANTPTVLGELAIADPALPTLLSVVVSYPQGSAPPDRAQIQAALAAALASINSTNATPVDEAQRTLAYSRLRSIVPLPGAPGATAATYGTRFVFTLATGLSFILEQETDEAYVLTPFERLSLNRVELNEESGNG